MLSTSSQCVEAATVIPQQATDHPEQGKPQAFSTCYRPSLPTRYLSPSRRARDDAFAEAWRRHGQVGETIRYPLCCSPTTHAEARTIVSTFDNTLGGDLDHIEEMLDVIMLEHGEKLREVTAKLSLELSRLSVDIDAVHVEYGKESFPEAHRLMAQLTPQLHAQADSFHALVKVLEAHADSWRSDSLVPGSQGSSQAEGRHAVRVDAQGPS